MLVYSSYHATVHAHQGPRAGGTAARGRRNGNNSLLRVAKQKLQALAGQDIKFYIVSFPGVSRAISSRHQSQAPSKPSSRHAKCP